MDRVGLKRIRDLVIIIILIILDQITKYIAVINLKEQPSVPIIKDIFELTYLENRGAAFGMFQDKIIFFVILTLFVLVYISVYYFRLPNTPRFNPLKLSLIFIVAGAIGNFIDRVYAGFVVDFFYFKLIDFPVFNVADCYVTIGAGLLIVLMLFYYKDEDLHMKKPKKEVINDSE